MRTTREAGSGVGLLGILLTVVIVLGLLWLMFGGRTAPTTTATPGTGIQLQPPPTTPITPRSPE